MYKSSDSNSSEVQAWYVEGAVGLVTRIIKSKFCDSIFDEPIKCEKEIEEGAKWSAR